MSDNIMLETQSCSASLVNASSALSDIVKQEVKGESNVNHAIAEISAELQRERQKNEELLNKISFLEAQIQQRALQSHSTHQQGQEKRSLKEFKRQKTEVLPTETENAIKTEKKNETKCLTLVNWMSMDGTHISRTEKGKDGESTADCDETDDSADEEDENTNANARKHVIFESNQDTKEELQCVRTDVSHGKKPPKVGFCPREVKAIIESTSLEQVNAQAHTMRKIIVFAPLGIRHGCDDMHDLDFNHFTILRKNEPYESPTNPGEHVLYYENPGHRRKIFYPNRHNLTLCPVRILEEEKAMRPPASSCPSCLFLCIKYGGRTRNFPQNEYVRQRMGRNKLKSFGPLICRTAMLANLRCGSFFFKALGITLLFMAGFPDDFVQRETNYRNLDLLLQKYYRTDEEAEGEELFRPNLEMNADTGCTSSERLTGPKPKAEKKKKKKKKQTNSDTKQPRHSTQATPLTIPSYSGATMSPLVTCHSQMAGPYYQIVPHHPGHGFVPPTMMYLWPHPQYTSPYHHGHHIPFPFSRSHVSNHIQQPHHVPVSHKTRGSALKEAESDGSSSGT